MNNTDAQVTRFTKEVAAPILAEFAKIHEDVPQRLYHYTSADGLIGILSTRSIWLTDLRYVNDMSELQYGRDLISQRAQAARNGSLSPLQSEFLSNIPPVETNVIPEKNVFSASFCEHGNLLSQWRAYRGQGGGYAIGFDFFHVVRLLSRQCELRRVIYDRQEQAAIVDGMLKKFLSAAAREEATDYQGQARLELLMGLAHCFRVLVSNIIFCFKHPDFREEREWRLVCFTSSDPTFDRSLIDMPQFRNYQGNVIPYHPVSFEKAVAASTNDLMGHPFPVVDLMIGPTINAELNIASVKKLLLSMNPDIDPPVRNSAIALRWL